MLQRFLADAHVGPVGRLLERDGVRGGELAEHVLVVREGVAAQVEAERLFLVGELQAVVPLLQLRERRGVAVFLPTRAEVEDLAGELGGRGLIKNAVNEGRLAMEFSRELFQEGLMATGIAFPTVAEGKARIRTIASRSTRWETN